MLLLDDPLDAPSSQAGQRDVVAVEEAEAVVLVLDVDLVAHPVRVLVDEAEDAVAGAGLELHGREAGRHHVDVRRVEAQVGGLAVLAQDGQGQAPILGGVVVEVEDVLDGAAVQVGDPVAGAPLVQAVQGRREGSDECDHGHSQTHGPQRRKQGRPGTRAATAAAGRTRSDLSGGGSVLGLLWIYLIRIRRDAGDSRRSAGRFPPSSALVARMASPRTPARGLRIRRLGGSMKASELILKLEKSLALHGDLEVRVSCGALEAPVEAIGHDKVRIDDGTPWRFVLVCPPPSAAAGHGPED